MRVPVTQPRLRTFMIAAAAILMTGITPLAVPAQARGTTTTRSSTPLLVVRTSGEAEAVRAATAPSFPASLTTEQVQVSLTPLNLELSTAGGPWKVNPATPIAASGRMNLMFVHAEMVSAAKNVAKLHASGAGGEVVLNYRASAAGEKSLIDCTVTAGIPMRLVAPGGLETTSTSGHLLAVYEAPDLEWTSFKVEAVAGGHWHFNSCEVSRLK